MDSTLIVTRFLFGALALVMFGLGLSLSAWPTSSACCAIRRR